ncbi:MAG: hypothetical protein CMN84_09765 [Spongiibacteraceae bacterium]|jgi:hypothetical protein|nr:hypothetical protein [Spongiibacteraceae bacterium]
MPSQEQVNQFLNDLVATPPEALFLFLLGVVACGVALLALARRRIAHKTERKREREKFKTVCRLVETQRKEVNYLQTRLHSLESYVDRLNAHQQRVLDSATQRRQRVDEAIGIAGRCADDIELSSRAGISPSEAKLIASLYRGPASS